MATSDIHEAFGKRLKLARLNKGMTQWQLGEIVGTEGKNLGSYERGQTMPTLYMAVRIAEGLEVSLDWLVGRTGEGIA